jgi:predicted ATPase/transcriptional regulator with XRE-family HTH domain
MAETSSFALALKQRRKAHDLTQQELANQVGCSVVTIQRIEQGKLRPSRQIVQRLAVILALPSDERKRFMIMARQISLLDAPEAQPDGVVGARSSRSLLPIPLTPLIGRVQEVAAVCAMLSDSSVRLLTLLGPAGTGKTRLALQVAADMQTSFANGVVFVDLAPISDSELVIARIAQALEIRETGGQPLTATLQHWLCDKHLLLILDNFEQVVAAAPLVAELLAAAPQLNVLLTSRVVVGVYGERTFLVPPLALPDLRDMPAYDQVLQIEAVRLFVERAQAAKPSFCLTDGNAPVVSEICHYLDGLPLALELAAARVRLLSPQALLERFIQSTSSRLQLLIGGPRTLPARQQTLRTTIDWSYNLLNDDERALFVQLGVFVGGWTLQAAEAVCELSSEQNASRNVDRQQSLFNTHSSILNVIEALLDNSLLKQVDGPGGDARFTMLEMIREYALEQLEVRGEAEALRKRHAACYLVLAETVAPQLHGADQLTWLNRMEQEHDNFRAALAWSAAAADSRLIGSAEAAELGLRLAAALAWFWFVRGYWSEGRTWLSGMLARGETAPPLVRAAALNQLGDLESQASNFTSADTHYQASLAIGRAAQDTPTIATALRGLARSMLMHSMRSFDQINALLQESLALFRELQDLWNIALDMEYLGVSAQRQGAYGRAHGLFEESLALFRRLRDSRHISLLLLKLGQNARLQGEYTRAEPYLDECLELAVRLRDEPIQAEALNILGNVARNQRNNDRAAVCYDRSLALCRNLGNPYHLVSVLQDQGYLAEQQGDQARAAVLLRESLVRGHELGYPWMSVWCLAGLGRVALAQGQAEYATQLLGATATLFEIFDPAMDPMDRADYERTVATARVHLSATTFDTAWAIGRAMTVEQAIAHGLNETPLPSTPAIPHPRA